MGGFSLNPAAQVGFAVAGAAFEAFRGRPREFSASAVMGRKRRTVTDYSGYRQLRKVARGDHCGHLIRRQDKLNKAVEAQLLTNIDRFQWMSSMNDTFGAYWLSARRYGPASNPAVVATAANIKMPLYMFDLTSLRINHNNGSTWSGVPFMRLCRGVSTHGTYPNCYYWDPVDGIVNCNANGVPSTSKLWQTERTPYTGNDPNSPYEKCMLDWADIRFQLWGTGKQPSTVEISIVRIPDVDLGPESFYVQGTLPTDTQATLRPVPLGTTDSTRLGKYTKFWTALLDRQIASDQVVRHQAADSNGMVYMYNKRFEFNPTATYENDATPHQVTHKIFYNMSMLGDYRSEGLGTGGYVDGFNPDVLTDIEKGVNSWPVIQGNKASTPQLRNTNSRVFLMIRGIQYSQAIGEANTGDPIETSDWCPSFDVQIRRKITII